MNKNLKNKKIIITGGLGFIGSNLAHVCLSSGADVHILDNQYPTSGANLYNIKDISEKINFIKGDIRNEQILKSIIKDADLIFHCAAHTSHPGSMQNPELDLDVNVRGTLILLEAVRKYSPSTTVIYTATSTQVGSMKIDPITELHPEFPRDIYSAHKGLAEKYMIIYAHAYKIKTISIRLPNVYGPKACIFSSDFGFVNYFIGCALQNKPMTIYGNGDQIRSLLYVDDVVNALICITNSETFGETFFISSNEFFTVDTIANTIEKIIGGSVKKIPWPQNRKQIEIGNIHIKDSLFRKKFKWIPQISFTEGLIKTKKYYKKCLSHYI